MVLRPMNAKNLNPFRSPWRIFALLAIPVLTPFALFVLIKLGTSPDLLTRPEPGVTTWNFVENPNEHHAWVCSELAKYHPTIEMENRYNSDCK